MALSLTPSRITSSVAIVNRRSTSVGIQYTVEDVYGTQIVTVNNGCASCTCGLEKYCVECSHRRVALAQEQAYLDEARVRVTYCAVYDIYGIYA